MVNTKIGFPRFAVVSLVGLLSIGSNACGFIFSHGPPDGYEQMTSFDCTTENTGPILDLVWGGLNVAGALAAASNPGQYQNSGQIVTVGLAWGVVSAAAAGTGFSKSSRCRAAKLQLAQRQGGVVPRSGPLYGDSIVQAVAIQPPVDTVAVGEQVQLVAAAHNSSGSVVPNQLFTWSSSNDAIASVGLAGLVSTHATGTVIIAARTAGIVGVVTVVVVQRR